MFAIRFLNVSKSYIDAGKQVDVVKNFSFDLEYGKSLAILGPSGCGKTTILQLAGLIDKHDSGRIEILGHNILSLNAGEINEIRRRDIAFIHQFHHLFPEFTAIENVIIPQLNMGIKKTDALENAMQILLKLGMESKKDAMPWQLSGGERQRIAIARAVVNKPKIVLADEPTGSLDPKNSEQVMQMILDLCKNNGSSLLFVTHNNNLAGSCDGHVHC